MKIAIIGGGSMGGAMAEGFLRCGGIAPGDITVSGPHIEKLGRFSVQGMNTATDNCAAAGAADIVVMAVKPPLAETVVNEMKSVLDYGRQILISVCAGISSAELTEWLGKSGGGMTFSWTLGYGEGGIHTSRDRWFEGLNI